jgi:uncharacterized protein (DUF2237 family)
MLTNYINKSFPGLPAKAYSTDAAKSGTLLATYNKNLESNALRDMLENQPAPQKNVFGEPLQTCSDSPETGFYRDGCCNTGPEDVGSHTVCVVMTAEFLAFSKKAGNDLSTPMPEFDFPGLQPGDRWCLCAARWQQAFKAGMAPRVVLSATQESALEIVALKDLKRYAIDLT